MCLLWLFITCSKTVSLSEEHLSEFISVPGILVLSLSTLPVWYDSAHLKGSKRNPRYSCDHRELVWLEEKYVCATVKDIKNKTPLQWVGCLACTWPTWFLSLASHIIPWVFQEWVLNPDQGVTPESQFPLPPQKNSTKTTAERFVFPEGNYLTDSDREWQRSWYLPTQGVERGMRDSSQMRASARRRLSSPYGCLLWKKQTDCNC